MQLTTEARLYGVAVVAVLHPPVKIIRSDQCWCVLGVEHVVHDCLESLALRQGYRVGAVCQELGISESYFREIFMRDVGLTPKEWMQWERMVVARRMLIWGHDPLDVSEGLGFSHPNSFRREFQVVHGVSPWLFFKTRVPDFS